MSKELPSAEIYIANACLSARTLNRRYFGDCAIPPTVTDLLHVGLAQNFITFYFKPAAAHISGLTGRIFAKLVPFITMT